MVQSIQNPASPQADTWIPQIIQLRTTITGLASPLLPFALLKQNPLPIVQRYLEALPQSSLMQTDIHTIAMEAWNQPFISLSAEQNFFLYAWSAVPGISPKIVQRAALSLGIATPGPAHTRWFTTRPVVRQQALVAWCIEIDFGAAASGGTMPEIVLSAENMLCLLPTNTSTQTHDRSDCISNLTGRAYYSMKPTVYIVDEPVQRPRSRQ